MKRKSYIFLIVFVIFLTFSGCQTTADNKQDGLKEITIGVMPDIDTVPILLADSQGFFEEEGLKVNIQQFKSALDRDAALQTGNLDGAISDMLGIVFLNDNGFNVKITSATNGSFKMLSSPYSNIESMKDIHESTIGISSNTIIDYLTDTMLSANKIPLNNVNREIIPKIPTRLEMLTNNQIDLATLPEPLASIAVNKGAKLISSSNDLNINSAYIIFTEDSLTNKSEEIFAFYNGYNKAVQYYNATDISEFIDIVIERGSFPPLIQQTLANHQFDLAFLPEESDVSNVQKWLNAKKLSDSDYTLSDLIEPSFVNK